jgi:ferredoxin-NADP reductase
MSIYTTFITKKQEIAEDTLEITMERPEGFNYYAGQYIQIMVDPLHQPDYRGNFRIFSLSSSPLDKAEISVAFRDGPSGFKTTLKQLAPKTSIDIEGPHGFFTLPEKTSKTVILLAGGIGITPFISMLRYCHKNGFKQQTKLIYATRNKETAAYLDELQKIAKKHELFSMLNLNGIVSSDYLKRNIKDNLNCLYYIAGPPAMINHCRNVLFKLAVHETDIISEEYTGY